ncbi:hypothetical protein XA68_10461 [Ophiocordyceps unilateralis]|uniref:Cytochrome P450 monooxygenase n=1 Tax=Ophiocordyceps unilateralis TaxID=268505 RepID=A0A2A9P2U4_OPHUN|nr:hypothetical protein XA68_10461 [Ophiocordyceps unilateralis]
MTPSAGQRPAESRGMWWVPGSQELLTPGVLAVPAGQTAVMAQPSGAAAVLRLWLRMVGCVVVSAGEPDPDGHGHSALTLAATLTAVVIATALLYLRALPRPLPGIPYNRKSARRLLGDVSEVRQAAYRRRWIWSQPRLHDAPISQAFLFPFRRPTVIVSDYRTAVDICARRIKEFDRGSRTRECVGITAPNFHFTMQSSDPRLRRHRELLRDLMTPGFLKEVVAPRVYDRAMLLVHLWRLKHSLAGARPFAADHDLCLATLDMISGAAFGMEKSEAALTRETERVRRFQSVPGTGPANAAVFARAAQSPETEALLDIADMVSIAQGSPFSTLAQWLALLKPSHARAHWHRRRLLRRQTAKSLHRLAVVGDGSVPESALDELLRREKMAASKAGRAPDFYSPAIRDEVLGYLLGGHDTTAALLAWWVKHMTRHQDVQARLRRAIRAGHPDALAQGRLPTVEEVVSAPVPYLDAVLEESLRYGSVATLIVRKATCNTQILGYPIPSGTDVIISLTGPSMTEPALAIPEALRSEACRAAKDRVPAWGDDVAEYRPERWLKDGAFDAQAGPSLVFSSGPRQCFGRKQAYLKLRTTVTLLVWSFAFDAIDEELDGWEMTERLVNLPKDCYVRLRKLPLVEVTQIGLPTDGDDAGEDATKLERQEDEAESHDGGPNLERVEPADGDGVAQALQSGGGALAREEDVSAEEVAVEEWGEEELIDDDFCDEGEGARGVVEVSREEDEPG